jgi:uncharacterized membrane protein YdjX (TVP38/TMEM64 family)
MQRQSILTKKMILISFIAIIALVVWALWPYLKIFTNQSEIRSIIDGAGVYGPILFMGLQALQVIVAPIPGTIISLAGGFIYDTFLATVYAMIGTTVGFLIVFIIRLLHCNHHP